MCTHLQTNHSVFIFQDLKDVYFPFLLQNRFIFTSTLSEDVSLTSWTNFCLQLFLICFVPSVDNAALPEFSAGQLSNERKHCFKEFGISVSSPKWNLLVSFTLSMRRCEVNQRNTSRYLTRSRIFQYSLMNNQYTLNSWPAETQDIVRSNIANVQHNSCWNKSSFMTSTKHPLNAAVKIYLSYKDNNSLCFSF